MGAVFMLALGKSIKVSGDLVTTKGVVCPFLEEKLHTIKTATGNFLPSYIKIGKYLCT